MIQMCNYHYSRSPINILRNKKNSNLSRTLSFSNKCGTVSFPKQRSKTWTNKNIRLNGRNGKSATPCNGQLCELYAAAVKGTHKLITERKDGTAVGSLFQWKNRIGTGCGKRRKVEVGISIWELAAHRTQYGWMGARHAAAAAAHNADGMNERSAAPNNGSGCVAASTNAACNRQSRWKLRAPWSRRSRRLHDHSQMQRRERCSKNETNMRMSDIRVYTTRVFDIFKEDFAAFAVAHAIIFCVWCVCVHHIHTVVEHIKLPQCGLIFAPA